MASKATFATRCQEISTALALLQKEAESTEEAYFDRGYNGGGASPIVDGDLTAHGITAATLAAFITLAQQLKNFNNNAAVTQGDYGSTLSKMRTDI